MLGLIVKKDNWFERKASPNANPKISNKSSAGLHKSWAKVIFSAKNYLDPSLTNKES